MDMNPHSTVKSISSLHSVPPTPRLWGLALITRNLYLSNAVASHNQSLLQAGGVTCIISVTPEVISSMFPSTEYINIPVADSPSAQLKEYFDMVADKIHLVESLHGRTLLHCAAGISRSPTLCLAYLMKYHQMSLLGAHAWLKACRPIIRPNSGFWKQLIEYEDGLFGKSSIKMVMSPLGVIPDIYEEETRGMIPC
ncbi:dual specificity protein phosphatase 18-like [Scyliorhinus canicula]|uniref:dual specificity protein phosphatase 18-like n=1 Tax=Scyliorhinus canicula TaxID=7830 RepID=UPI0018F6ABD5|nr:dual specificity protein phosphatase 18-like [Scyliorhinus canicula]XP_038647417.1 dual specificity protein phosphatase 18-like [Scyliorhinus canicula]